MSSRRCTATAPAGATAGGASRAAVLPASPTSSPGSTARASPRCWPRRHGLLQLPAAQAAGCPACGRLRGGLTRGRQIGECPPRNAATDDASTYSLTRLPLRREPCGSLCRPSHSLRKVAGQPCPPKTHDAHRGREVRSVQADRDQGSAVAQRGHHQAADLVRRRSARRQPGPDRADGLRPQDADVQAARARWASRRSRSASRPRRRPTSTSCAS